MDGTVNRRGRYSVECGRGNLIDWKELGVRLRQMGYGISDISRALNLPLSTVSSWFNDGIEPRYSSGVLLLGLYREVQANHKTNELYELARVSEIS